MHPAEVNVDLAEAMVDELEPYLLSHELFWPITRRPAAGLPPYPRLTIGGLLLTLDELSVQESEMPPGMAARCTRLRAHLDAQQTRWASAFENKASQELGSRLNLWQAYLDELEESSRWAEDYPHEVRQRVMASRLMVVARQPTEAGPDFHRLQDLDRRLRRTFRRGEFIWEARLRAAYPEGEHWFLYGRPHS